MRLVALFLLAAVAAAQPPSVLTEFRVFDGSREVTAHATVRLTRRGGTGSPVIIEPARAPHARHASLSATVPVGLYDARVSIVRNGVTAVVTAEGLLLMAYPDEGGRHLEVINFAPDYGALLLRPRSTRRPADLLPVPPRPAPDMPDANASLYRAGDHRHEVAPPLAGDDYVLFVVPSGRYDVHARQDVDPLADTAGEWMLDVEIPAGRTRLKTIQ